MRVEVPARAPRPEAPAVRSLLAETMLAYCNPATAGDVVATALRAAAFVEVPEDPALFLRFTRVHLRDAMIDRLGLEAADAMLDRIEQVLERSVSADSGTYRRVSLARVALRKQQR